MPLANNVKDVMLAVSAKRTVKFFNKLHYYNQHKQFVDKSHIDECSYIVSNVVLTFYNDRLNVIGLR